jgi:hypothetical protein
MCCVCENRLMRLPHSPNPAGTKQVYSRAQSKARLNIAVAPLWNAALRASGGVRYCLSPAGFHHGPNIYNRRARPRSRERLRTDRTPAQVIAAINERSGRFRAVARPPRAPL